MSKFFFPSLAILCFHFSCTDVATKTLDQRFISDQEIISSIRSVLVTDGSLSLSKILHPNLLIDNASLSDIADLCDLTIDTTVTTNVVENDITLDLISDFVVQSECNALGIPTKFTYQAASEGQYTAGIVVGNFLQASNYAVSFSPLDTELGITGTTGQSGNITVSEDKEEILTTIRFSIDELNINLLETSINKGTAQAYLKYVTAQYEEVYEVQLNYLGNEMIELIINGSEYLIDLGN